MPHFGFYLMTYFKLVYKNGSMRYPKLKFLRSFAKLVPYAEIYCRELVDGTTPLLERWENGVCVYKAPESKYWLYTTHERLKQTIVKHNYQTELIEYYEEE